MPLLTLPAMVDVTSSNVSRVGYAERELWVQFLDKRGGTRDGSVYVYDDVDEDVYLALLRADAEPEGSVGSVFHRLVKLGGYVYRRMG